MSFFMDFEKKGNVLCVRVCGELDHHTSTELKEKTSEIIEREEISHLVLNLDGLTFMDSAGLGMILGRYNQIKDRKGEMIVCSVGDTVGRMFDMSGVFKIIRVEPSEESALNSLGVV